MGVARVGKHEKSPSVSTRVSLSGCLPGSGARPVLEDGLLICATCEAYTYSPVLSFDECIPCPNMMVPLEGALECRECLENSSPSSQQAVVDPATGLATWPNCSCDVGFYTPTFEFNTECVPCPGGGRCDGGIDQPLALENYYDTSAARDGSVFSRCLRPSACVGGVEQCSPSTHGYMCSECRPSFYTGPDETCQPCPSLAYLLFMTLVTLVLVLAAITAMYVLFTAKKSFKFGVLKPLKSRTHNSPRTLSQAILFFQIVGIVGSSKLNWSDSAQSAFAVFSASNLDLRVFSTECTVPSYWDQYMILLAFPVLFAMVAAVVVFAMQSFIPSGFRVAMFERTIFFLSIYLYVPVVKLSLQFFDCTRLPDGEYALDADLSKRCFKADWLRVLPVAIGAVAIYVIGVPVLIGVRLQSARRLLNASATLFRLGSYFEPYRRKYYWYELASMIKRGGVVAATLFFSQVPLLLLFTLTLVFGASLVLQAHSMPFFRKLHNQVELVLAVFLTIILGIGFLSFANRFPNSTTKTGMDVLLICTLIISVLFIVVMLVFETFQIVRRRRNKDGGNKDGGNKDGGNKDDEAVSFSSVEQEERVEDEVAVVSVLDTSSQQWSESSLMTSTTEEDVEVGGAGEKEKTTSPALVYVDTILEKAMDEALGEVNSIENALALLDSVVVGVQLSDHDNWDDDQALHGDIGLLGISRRIPDVSDSCDEHGDELDDDDEFTFVTVDSDSMMSASSGACSGASSASPSTSTARRTSS